MGITWTEEQQRVISLRDRNILVSAAAGSGKTAVLVQRILSKVMDEAHPVDVDRLLIMTFTRAAAGEMRERLSSALEKALMEDPCNEHLQRQMTLIHTAQITTIDGFCAYIIRNYFHLIGLDPGYRTADEGELKLLKQDVLKELLEDAYASEDKNFHCLVDCYAAGKTDEGIRDYILKVYDSAMSQPEPKKWLESCLEVYETDSTEELAGTEWMKLLWETAEQELTEAERLLGEGRKLCMVPGGPYIYEEMLSSDLLLLDSIRKKVREQDYDGVAELLENPSFARLSTKKVSGVEPALRDRVKDIRNQAKDMLKELGVRYFPGREAELLRTMKLCKAPMEGLVRWTEEFMDRFAEKKREKNLLDFTDMEHFALKILRPVKEGDEERPSQAAAELSEKYDEVMIDEYQDSNLVQEYITSYVSGWINHRRNVFMVGDVKQSIYRFRLARPELFMEKYHTYTTEDSREQKIDLHKNFRSRHEVLDSVNYIFRRLMGEDLGGVNYDEDAALNPGAVFPEGNDPDFPKTEILLVEKDSQGLEEETGSQTDRELEALAVARRIIQMTGKDLVLDKKTGAYRPVQYGDIVVLLRTASGWAETFSEVFASQGIPAYTASGTGYFSAAEVVTVLNFLRICSNPLQDIPMAGVLRSPIVGCTAQEMALLRCEHPQGMLYDSVLGFVEDGQMELFPGAEREVLKEKLKDFLALLEEVRNMAAYTPVHQLILHVLKVSGYGDYARALPDGEQRGANLHMLVERAMSYEKTSYRGLFNFVRYIENLQKYEVDFGEVNLAGAGEGSVQIMTIHKSKGLEFPIVFAAGMGKPFNFQDINASLLVHPELGFGADAILPEKRLIVATLHKQVVRRQLLKESLGEELRVLYVALTRAREKLILAGTIGKLEKQVRQLAGYQDGQELLPVSVRMRSRNYWDYVLPALAQHRCMDELFLEYGIAPGKGDLHDAPAEFVLKRVTAGDLVQEEISAQADSEIQEALLKGWDSDRVYHEEIRKVLDERFSYGYPYEHLCDIPAKVSVSELKKRSYQGDYDREEVLFWEPDIVPLIPAFILEKEEEFTGAARGTAYHRVMECLDYHNVSDENDIEGQIQAFLRDKKLSGPEADCVVAEDVLRFVQSPLGLRMKRAALEGRLFREQPFVFSVPSSSIDARWNGEETVLVQGIIDAFFLEGDEIVLVDYKTDRVSPGEEQKLIDLYHVQLEDYGQALERLMKKRVKETYIYSFALHKALSV